MKRLYQALPYPLQKLAREWVGRLRTAPFTPAGRRERWITNVYHAFGQSERMRIFLSIARYLHINRPIPGYYFEFGCNEARTMRMAWSAFRHLFDFTYVGFDSFEGLPEIGEIDRQPIWEKGKLAFAEDAFIKLLTESGMPREKLMTVKGFYDRSLTTELKARFAPHKAAVIYIDCDLYTSTVPVLDWTADFLQRGTVIVFDDWNCFHGDPERGERRAWKEFREKNPQLEFVEFVRTAEAQAFLCLSASPSGNG